VSLEFLHGQIVLARWKHQAMLGEPEIDCYLVRPPGEHRTGRDVPLPVRVVGGDAPLEVLGPAAVAVGFDLCRLGLHRARKVIVAGGELFTAFHRTMQLHNLELEGIADPASAFARELEQFHAHHGKGLPFMEDLTR
jgi:hypothetical protein